MTRDYNEFADKCESCKVKVKSRMYHRLVEAFNHDIEYWSLQTWRRLCPDCWNRAEKGII